VVVLGAMAQVGFFGLADQLLVEFVVSIES
jgi:hypothetical protein